MRKKLLLGNWKMNKTVSEAKAFALASKEMVDFAVSHSIDVGVAPTYLSLETVVANRNPHLIVSAQNCSQFDHGAYTGEISIPMPPLKLFARRIAFRVSPSDASIS